MAQTDMLRRYLDAGIAFTKMTQERAEAIVRDLVGAGEVGADQASSAVQDLVDRSRENTERLLETVRAEINVQIGNLGLATRDDIESLRQEIAALRDRPMSAAPSPASATKAPATRAPAPKAAATAAPARSTPTKSSPAKSSPTKAAPGKVAGGAVKLPATKAPASKAPASKAPATKKSAGRSAPATKAAPAKKA